MASEKVLAMIEEVKALTVLELADLVKALEEEFGVSAAAATVAVKNPKKSLTTLLKLSKRASPKLMRKR